MTTPGGGRADARPVRATSRRVALPAWLRKSADKVPTAWFGAILTGAFLAVTAAFGSLNTAPVPVPPTIALGETVSTDLYDITVTDVAIVVPTADRLTLMEAPRRQVQVTATVTNHMTDAIGLTSKSLTWYSGLVTSGEGSVVDIGIPSEYAASSRYVDAFATVMLQPGLSSHVIIAFMVADDDLTDDLTITLWQGNRHTGQSILSERDEYVLADTAVATLTLTPDVVPEDEEDRRWQ